MGTTKKQKVGQQTRNAFYNVSYLSLFWIICLVEVSLIPCTTIEKGEGYSGTQCTSVSARTKADRKRSDYI